MLKLLWCGRAGGRAGGGAQLILQLGVVWQTVIGPNGGGIEFYRVDLKCLNREEDLLDWNRHIWTVSTIYHA